ncbi:hypothetical protein D3C73_1129730 [compost metagenome]
MDQSRVGLILGFVGLVAPLGLILGSGWLILGFAWGLGLLSLGRYLGSLGGWLMCWPFPFLGGFSLGNGSAWGQVWLYIVNCRTVRPVAFSVMQAANAFNPVKITVVILHNQAHFHPRHFDGGYSVNCFSLRHGFYFLSWGCRLCRLIKFQSFPI